MAAHEHALRKIATRGGRKLSYTAKLVQGQDLVQWCIATRVELVRVTFHEHLGNAGDPIARPPLPCWGTCPLFCCGR